MRQAGRYLPEYNATRAKAGSFLALAKNPTLATEVTLQPLDRYPLDAAILFSDILTIPDAMGLGLSFEAGEGPRFSKPLRTEADVAKLRVADLSQLQYVFDAVSEIRRALIQGSSQRVPLIGFSGSPWTLACYMVEGSGSDDFRTTKTMLYQRPDLMQKILDVNIQSVTAYLNAQVDAGAQALMLFDTWGGLLPDGWYQKTSLLAMQKVIAGLRREKDGQRIPILVFTKGGGIWLKDIAQCGADVIGLDWTYSLARARQELVQNKATVALQVTLTHWPYLVHLIKSPSRLDVFWMTYPNHLSLSQACTHWMGMCLIWVTESLNLPIQSTSPPWLRLSKSTPKFSELSSYTRHLFTR